MARAQRALNDLKDQAFSLLYYLAPPPPRPISKLDQRHKEAEREKTRCREMGGGDGRGAKSYDGEKDLSSIKHSIVPGKA
jgi:hypothetical protein